MSKRVRASIVVGAVLALASTAAGAQSPGEAVYRQKCQTCHGADGMASSGVGKVMKVKPIGNPEVKKLTEAEMIQMTRDGVAKMQAYKGELTDAQIKASVVYFRTFLK
jgi:mono/diheme cytochrome c family protein